MAEVADALAYLNRLIKAKKALSEAVDACSKDKLLAALKAADKLGFGLDINRLDRAHGHGQGQGAHGQGQGQGHGEGGAEDDTDDEGGRSSTAGAGAGAGAGHRRSRSSTVSTASTAAASAGGDSSLGRKVAMEKAKLGGQEYLKARQLLASLENTAGQLAEAVKTANFALLETVLAIAEKTKMKPAEVKELQEALRFREQVAAARKSLADAVARSHAKDCEAAIAAADKLGFALPCNAPPAGEEAASPYHAALQLTVGQKELRARLAAAVKDLQHVELVRAILRAEEVKLAPDAPELKKALDLRKKLQETRKRLAGALREALGGRAELAALERVLRAADKLGYGQRHNQVPGARAADPDQDLGDDDPELKRDAEAGTGAGADADAKAREEDEEEEEMVRKARRGKGKKEWEGKGREVKGREGKGRDRVHLERGCRKG